MRMEYRKAALRDKGYTAAKLADEIGVGRSAVSQVLNERSTSRRIQQRTAEIIGLDFDAVWPERAKNALRRGKTSQQGALMVVGEAAGEGGAHGWNQAVLSGF